MALRMTVDGWITLEILVPTDVIGSRIVSESPPQKAREGGAAKNEILTTII